mgnify:CR=1 FL=1
MNLLAVNKKAHFDYDILEEFEAGLVLRGFEVKSAKAGRISLRGAFIFPTKNSLTLNNAHIAHYGPAGKIPDYDPENPRQLLLKKKEITYLKKKSQANGLTIVPLSVYTKGKLIKLKFALAKGKKKFDKRFSIKKREENIRIGRILKEHS